MEVEFPGGNKQSSGAADNGIRVLACNKPEHRKKDKPQSNKGAADNTEEENKEEDCRDE